MPRGLHHPAEAAPTAAGSSAKHHATMRLAQLGVADKAAVWRDDEGMEVVRRRWSYAAPPWRYREALVAELDAWLPEGHGVSADLGADGLVRLAPWPDPEVDEVHVAVEPKESEGTRLTVVALGPAPLPEEVRHRLSVAFGQALRDHVDGP